MENITKENIICGNDIPKYILDSKCNLSQHFIRLLSEFGNRTSVVDAHDGTSFTFANILNLSYNIASWLKYEWGIKKSDIVGIFSENTIWYPSFILGIWHVGGICALLNPLYNTKELEHVLNITKPKMLISSQMGLEIVRQTVQKLDFIKYVCPIDVICNAMQGVEEINFVPTKCDNNETCVILFSSGTSGLPKGVELTHKSLFLMTSILNHIDKFVLDSDIMLGLVPMFHGYGLLLMCICMEIGTKLVVLKYFDENLFLKSIEVYKITILFAVPPLVLFLAKSPLIDKYDLSSLDTIYSGAAPLSQEIQNEVGKRIMNSKSNTPIKVFQGYGMTELSIVATIPSHTDVSIHGSVGKVMSGMCVKVIDVDNGQPLGMNKTGELCFKGPMVMKGYYNNSKETLAIIDSEGWLHTGDVGYYDKDNNFYIVDRLKELIKYKGYQVAPAELESLLLTHPEIRDVAVIGIPNVTAGEIPMAFVVKTTEDSALTENDVIKFVNSQVSAQKRLRGGVRFVNIIPKNPSGKILRRLLKSELIKSKF